MQRSVFLVSFFAILCTLPLLGEAHTSGASHEEIVGPYKIDIGYDPVAPEGGDRMVFDFGTFMREGKPADFTYVWVRIEHNNQTILATGIARADFGPTSLLFQLPQELEGEVVVHARYQADDEVLAESNFPLTINRSDEKERDTRNTILGAVGLCILSGALGALLSRYVRKI